MTITDNMVGKTVAKAEEQRDAAGELVAIELTFTDGGQFRANVGCMFHETEGYPFGYLALSYLGAPSNG